MGLVPIRPITKHKDKTIFDINPLIILTVEFRRGYAKPRKYPLPSNFPLIEKALA
jgi:hypothetical protein